MAHLFDQLNPIGQIGEAAALDLLKGRSLEAYKVDHKKYPYDLETVSQKGIIKTWEIKTVDIVKIPYDNYVGEIEQLKTLEASRIPAHIKHCNVIDYIAYWDRNREELLVYDNKKFVSYLIKNKEKAFTIYHGTAKVVRFPRHSIDAGYCGTIKK